ncbi:hypothetical protein PhCBS80983_g05488 [Powellomyces hirtus]|uniref:SH3 domain-containing protein n=1 Tax=Powellomyces hirtus TaxID=109895 RepID=A0A507DWA2_9FUNG|nr:hypothetical protein PhCBS80983_g05488 [Powellomyces hirtus]
MSSKTTTGLAAAALCLLSVLAKVHAANSQVPKECLPIGDTTACAPFGKGHYINATELGLVYGLSGPVPDTKYWDKLVRDVTSGGEQQMNMWKNWAQCAGYKGEPIQYYRTYTCMTDLYMFSSGCNKATQPPAPICAGACDAYGGAVASMIEDEEICPLKTAKNDAENKQIAARRSYALTGAQSCRKIVSSWNARHDQRQCQWGVDDDQRSCGFSGDTKTADQYCKDMPSDPCCRRRGAGGAATHPKSDSTHSSPSAESHQASFVGQKPVVSAHGATQSQASLIGTKPAVAAQGATQVSGADGPEAASEPAPSFFAQNKTAIIASSAGIAALLVAGAVIGTMYARKSRSNAAGSRSSKSAGGAGAVPFLAPMTKTSDSSTAATPLNAKHQVVYDYAPQLIDELELAKGDLVEVWASYDDGWGKGTNVRTGNKGTFPMACVELLRE